MIEQEGLNKFIYTSQLKEKLDSFGQDFSAKDDVFTKRTKVLAVLNQILDPETTTVSTDLSDLDHEVFRALIAYALHGNRCTNSIMEPILEKIVSIVHLELEQISHAINNNREPPPPTLCRTFESILFDLPDPYGEPCNDLVKNTLEILDKFLDTQAQKELTIARLVVLDDSQSPRS